MRIPTPERGAVAARIFGQCLQWEFDKDLTARERDELQRSIEHSFVWFANTFFPHVEYTIGWRVGF